MQNENKVTEFEKFYYCLLIASHLQLNSNDCDISFIIFIDNWLTHAEAEQIFDECVSQDVRWLKKEIFYHAPCHFISMLNRIYENIRLLLNPSGSDCFKEQELPVDNLIKFG